MEQSSSKQWIPAVIFLAIAIAAPFVLPHNMAQLLDLMVFILIALGWDMLGGQMGYNSFGNILFFGVGMYIVASTQVISGGYSLAEYNSAKGGNLEAFTLAPSTFVISLLVGLLLAAVANFLIGLIVGRELLQTRGHYFAVGTLGLGVAAGEFAGTFEILGGGSGMNFIQPPDGVPLASLLYFLALGTIAVFFLFLVWLHRTRFGLVMNAIRDNEDKAEAMGLPTERVKAIAWAVAAAFTAIAGGLYGSGKNFIDPTEVAFSLPTIGVWMLLMPLIGGKGTIWGPIIGAVVFQVLKEAFWQWLFGWQRVALGLLIVIIVVFFPDGVMGGIRALRNRMRGAKTKSGAVS